jgi:hypothetical protein
MWMGLIQSAKGLTIAKSDLLPDCISTGTLAFSCLWTETSAFPWFPAYWCSLKTLELVSLYNCVGQFLIINLTAYIQKKKDAHKYVMSILSEIKSSHPQYDVAYKVDAQQMLIFLLWSFVFMHYCSFNFNLLYGLRIYEKINNLVTWLWGTD